MTQLQRTVRSLGDLGATHELYERGYGRTALRLAVHSGEILRVRKGWYVNPQLGLELQQAARVGGKLACVSAARAHGLWVPGNASSLHVEVPPRACQLRSRNDFRQRLSDIADASVAIYWREPEGHRSRVLVSAARCVHQVIQTHPAEFGFVVAESARYRRAITATQWSRILASLPPRLRRELSRVASVSESGTESMFSFRIGGVGVRFRQQVQIGIDRVDFLIGESLVVEIDSREHHDPVADCARDARLSILGYRVLRFYYHHVVHEWDLVEAAVLAALARGDQFFS